MVGGDDGKRPVSFDEWDGSHLLSFSFARVPLQELELRKQEDGGKWVALGQE